MVLASKKYSSCADEHPCFTYICHMKLVKKALPLGPGLLYSLRPTNHINKGVMICMYGDSWHPSVRKRRCPSFVRFCSMPTFWPPFQRLITFKKFSTPSPWTYQQFWINLWTHDPCFLHERRHLRYHLTQRIFKTHGLIGRTVSTTDTKERELEPYHRVGQAEKPREDLVCVYPSSLPYLLQLVDCWYPSWPPTEEDCRPLA